MRQRTLTAQTLIRRQQNASVLCTRDIEDYLRANGWEQECSIPGSFWLWRKAFGGRDYTCTTDMAIQVQAEAEELGL